MHFWSAYFFDNVFFSGRKKKKYIPGDVSFKVDKSLSQHIWLFLKQIFTFLYENVEIKQYVKIVNEKICKTVKKN